MCVANTLPVTSSKFWTKTIAPLQTSTMVGFSVKPVPASEMVGWEYRCHVPLQAKSLLSDGEIDFKYFKTSNWFRARWGLRSKTGAKRDGEICSSMYGKFFTLIYILEFKNFKKRTLLGLSPQANKISLDVLKGLELTLRLEFWVTFTFEGRLILRSIEGEGIASVWVLVFRLTAGTVHCSWLPRNLSRQFIWRVTYRNTRFRSRRRLWCRP